MSRSIKLAVLLAPPMGHVARAVVLIRALAKLISVEVTCFIPHIHRFDYESTFPDINFVKIEVNDNDWIGQGEQFALAMKSLELDTHFDAVLYDTNPAQWLHSLDLSEVPTICVTNIFLTQMAKSETQQFEYFSKNKDRYTSARRAAGLPGLKSVYDLYEADLVVLADHRSIVSQFPELPRSYISEGSIYWSYDGEFPVELHGLRNILLFAFGSTGRLRNLNLDDIERLRQHVAASELLFVGNTGKNPARKYTYDLLPVERILPNCSAVITQGGAGSCYQAIQSGKPVLIFPNHRNHKILGGLIESAGWGCVIDEKEKLERFFQRDFMSLAENAKRISTMGCAESATSRAAQKIAQFLLKST